MSMANSLKELFFIEYVATNKGKRHVARAGQVLSEVGNGYFLVHLVNFITGKLDCFAAVHLSQMCTWKLYETVDDYETAIKEANQP